MDEHKKELKTDFMKDWNDLMNLSEIIQKEVELEPIKPIEEFTPEGKQIKKLEDN